MEAVWVPIFGLLSVFGGTVAIVALALRFKARKMEHDEIMKAIELGQELPMVEIKRKYNYLNDLRIGVFLMAIGFGLVAFLGDSYSSGFERVGYVPIALGLGFMVMAFFLKGISDKEAKNGNGNHKVEKRQE